MAGHRPYTLTPLPVGAEVHGIQLQQPQPDEVVQQIKSDVTK